MTIKTILAGSAAALALTGGIAYAATTGSPPAAARAAVTSAVLPQQGQYTIALARYGRYGWLYADHRCDWRGHAYQRQPARLVSHRQPARLVSHRQGNGYQHRDGYGYQGYRSGWSGTGSRWGHGSGRHGGCW